MTDIHVGGDVKCGFKVATDWDADPSGSDTYTLLRIPGFNVAPNVPLITPDRARGKRELDADDVSVISNAVPSLSFDITALKDELDYWLYLVFGNVTEEETGTAFKKIFTWPTTQPDYSATSPVEAITGNFCWLAPDPLSDHDHVIDHAIARSLKLSCSPDDNDGFLKASLDLVGKGIDTAHNSVGSYTASSLDQFHFGDLLDFYVATMDFVGSGYGFEMTLNNNAKPVPSEFQTPSNYAIPKHETTGSITMLHGALGEAVLSSYFETGSPAQLRFVWGTDDTDGYLLIITSAFFTGFELDHSEELLATFPFIGRATQVELCNDIDRAW